MTRGPGRTGRPWQRLRRRVIDESTHCGKCGRPLHPERRWPDDWSSTAGHIIPLCEGGHPTDRANLQAEHFICNREAEIERRRQRALKTSRDW